MTAERTPPRAGETAPPDHDDFREERELYQRLRTDPRLPDLLELSRGLNHLWQAADQFLENHPDGCACVYCAEFDLRDDAFVARHQALIFYDFLHTSMGNVLKAAEAEDDDDGPTEPAPDAPVLVVG